MEELPIAAGLQIIDAELYSKGVDRIYASTKPAFDSLALIDKAMKKLERR